MKSKIGTIQLLFSGALLLLCAVSSSAARQHDYDYHVAGNPEDVKAQTSGGLMLMGGGTDVDEAFKWMIQKSGGGDFVVIRASGTAAYNRYLKALGKLDSVETLIFKSRKAASDPFLLNKIRNAEALFIAGGDQANYINYWKDTPVQKALQELAAKNVPLGGTSAGLAVLGEFLFPALHDTITSKEALANPYSNRLVLEKNFLKLAPLHQLITDSHFVERDRMGRLITFLARILKDGWAKQAYGIGIDRETAVLVEADGSASLAGKNAAFFLRADHQPEVCAKDSPLNFSKVWVQKLSGKATFHIPTWQAFGGTSYQLSVETGQVVSTQSNGQIY